jgi:hypothetical protein
MVHKVVTSSEPLTRCLSTPMILTRNIRFGSSPIRELAEIDAMHFNRCITIPSSLDGSYTIFDFQVEEFATDHFVIFANAPFIVTERGTRNAEHSVVD